MLSDTPNNGATDIDITTSDAISRLIGGISDAALKQAELSLNGGIYYNPEFSFLDDNKMIIYLFIRKGEREYRAKVGFENVKNPIRPNHPEDMFTIRNHEIDIEFEKEDGSGFVAANKSEFDDQARRTIAIAMKSFIKQQIVEH